MSGINVACLSPGVIPAQAGIQSAFSDVRTPGLDSRPRGNDIVDEVTIPRSSPGIVREVAKARLTYSVASLPV